MSNNININKSIQNIDNKIFNNSLLNNSLLNRITIINDMVNYLKINNNIFFTYTVIYEKYELCKFLIKNLLDININFILKRGKTPLIYSIENENIEIIKLLIDNRADVNLVYYNKETPLTFAIQNIKIENNNIENRNIIEKRNIEIIKLLIDHGSDLNPKISKTPLHCAIEVENIEVIELLIKKGAEVNLESDDGRTPLHCAIEIGNIEVIKLLIDKGANVNLKNKNKYTPLLKSIDKKNEDIIRLLLEKGADVNFEDNVNYTPLIYLINEIFRIYSDEHTKFMIKNIKSSYENIKKSVLESSKIKILSLITLLIDKGANVNLKNKNKYTPLMYVMFFKNKYKNLSEIYDAVSILLIENGAKINEDIKTLEKMKK